MLTITTWEFGEYRDDLAPPFTPPLDTATIVTCFNDGAFSIQIPADRKEATAAEIAEAGLELGVGATTLGEYVELIS